MQQYYVKGETTTSSFRYSSISDNNKYKIQQQFQQQMKLAVISKIL